MNKLAEFLLRPWLAQAWEYGYNTGQFEITAGCNDCDGMNPYREGRRGGV